MAEREFEHLFGQIAIREGMVTAERVAECLAAQKGKARGSGKRIGELMMAKGYLKEEHIRSILATQQKLAKEGIRRLGQYELVSKLGQGGMGTVYLAKHITQKNLVALKVLPADMARDVEFLDRFRREARVVMSLNHPNIVGCFEVGVSGGMHFIAMEYIEGKDAETLIEEKGNLPGMDVLKIARQMAAALSAAYAKGVVHRDMKPANILLDKDGTAKLTDLGLAMRRGTDTRVTQTGVAVGTPYYISPEQARGEQDVDVRSDIYSLGASLYHMITGQPPFPGENAVVIMSKHVSEDPLPVRRLAPQANEGIAILIEKMMAKRPEDRHQTPEELLADIETIEQGGVPQLKRARIHGKSSGGRAPIHPPSVGPLTAQRRVPFGAVLRKATGASEGQLRWVLMGAGLALLLSIAAAVTWAKTRGSRPNPNSGTPEKTPDPDVPALPTVAIGEPETLFGGPMDAKQAQQFGLEPEEIRAAEGVYRGAKVPALTGDGTFGVGVTLSKLEVPLGDPASAALRIEMHCGQPPRMFRVVARNADREIRFQKTYEQGSLPAGNMAFLIRMYELSRADLPLQAWGADQTLTEVSVMLGVPSFDPQVTLGRFEVLRLHPEAQAEALVFQNDLSPSPRYDGLRCGVIAQSSAGDAGLSNTPSPDMDRGAALGNIAGPRRSLLLFSDVPKMLTGIAPERLGAARLQVFVMESERMSGRRILVYALLQPVDVVNATWQTIDRGRTPWQVPGASGTEDREVVPVAETGVTRDVPPGGQGYWLDIDLTAYLRRICKSPADHKGFLLVTESSAESSDMPGRLRFVPENPKRLARDLRRWADPGLTPRLELLTLKKTK